MQIGLENQLAERRASGRLRKLRQIMPADGAHILVERRRLVNFASNDYLGLSDHPALKQRAIEYIQRFGVGSTASRLLSGNLEPYDHIERKLASLKGTETALILPTGFQTNVTLLSALSADKTLLACDRFCHVSLLKGAQLSGGRWTRYEHNDLNDLDCKLAQAGKRYAHKWIVSESVFSMDGDRVDIQGLLKIATAHGASLLLDEAHATGVLGELGMGLSVGQRGVTVAMGTFGKGLGSFGAYVACSRMLKDYLINFCAGLIYSTALPPAVLGSIDAALDLVATLEPQRRQLLENADQMRNRLHKLGYDTNKSTTQIIPIIVGKDEDAAALAQYLEEGGIFAPAIRTPTVPDGTARIRLSLTVNHTREHLERILSLLRSFHAH